MKKYTVSFIVVGLTTVLLSGCGEEEAKQTSPSSPATQEQPAVAPSASEKAEMAVEDASSSVKEAASAVVEQVQEKAAGAKEKVSETSAAMVEGASEMAADAKQSVTEAGAAALETTANKVAEVAAAVEAAVTPAGEKTYKSMCFSCHDMGVAGAPKTGDAEAWAPRIAAGKEALYANAINGKGAMPAKGGNPSFSDEEVKAAVDYMLSQSE